MSLTSIQLYFSHAVEQLVGHLGEQLLSSQGRDFLTPNTVIVPNGNMQRYLQLSLAELNGVCANVEFPFLESGLYAAIEAVSSEALPKLLNGRQMGLEIWRILHHLEADRAAQPIALQNYFPADDGVALRSKKRWQLSHKLASLFLDYEAQRGDMVAAWQQGKSVFSGSGDATLRANEEMQRFIYLQVVEQSRKRSLWQLERQLEWAKLKPSNQALHVFTPSRLSDLHRRILCRLGEFYQLHIYQLNVCAEYWEDMQTEGEDIWLQRLNGTQVCRTDAFGTPTDEPLPKSEQFFELSESEHENPLLKAWGKPGREALKLFSELENDALHFAVRFSDDWLAFEPQDDSSLLQSVQNSVLFRLPAEAKLKLEPAPLSLQFAVAPSIEREVAEVYHQILQDLQHNPQLKLHEIAILVTDMSRYRFVLEQIFEQYNRRYEIQLPYSIIDGSVVKESRYAAAVMGLFAVLEGDFVRSSVFNLLQNPCLQAANDVTAEELETWLLWCDELGIFCGFNKLYPFTDERSSYFTWQQGLSRLRLSLARLSDDLPAEVDAALVGKFSWLLDSLYQYKKLLNTRQSAKQWGRQLSDLFEQFLTVAEDDNKESKVQMSLQQSLQWLADELGEQQFEFADISCFIEHELSALSAGKGSYLSGGLVCAALQPMRPIPFKATYILGLDEYAFPGQSGYDTLNLVQKSRRIGDVNSIENNNYLFLETLMCSRERLYLSYVGMNLEKDETVAASPIIETLLQHCKQLLANDVTSEKQLVQKIPLQPTEYNIDTGSDRPVSIVATAETQTTTATSIDISIEQLAAFLDNPYALYLKRQGILSQHSRDSATIDQEPTSLKAWQKSELFQQTVGDCLEQGKPEQFAENLLANHQRLLRKSQVPLLELSDLAELETLSKSSQWQQLFDDLSELKPLEPLRIGDAQTSRATSLNLPPAVFTLQDGRQVRVHAAIEHLFQSPQGISRQVVFGSSKYATWHRYLLKPFLAWCLLQQSQDFIPSDDFVPEICFVNKIKSIKFNYLPHFGFANRQQLADYWLNLLTDFCSERDEFLPFSLLSSLTIDNNPDLPPFTIGKKLSYLAKPLEQLTDVELDRLQQQYQKSLKFPDFQPIYQLLEVEPCDDFLQLYKRRLQPLLAMNYG